MRGFRMEVDRADSQVQCTPSPFQQRPRLSMLAARLLQPPSAPLTGGGAIVKPAKKEHAAEPAERRSRGRRLSKLAAREASSSSDA